ncbi:MAG: AlpA family phage regulatory protein [Magnetospirillum sp.]|nr:MAG: AlpA family phage regulatory protein [Magnetospirillum sp.]
MTERLLRMPEVQRRVGLKKTAIYARIRDGKFPAPRKLGTNYAVWLESAIDAWIQERISETEPVQGAVG